MQDGKRLTGIVLLVILAFGAGWLLPRAGAALDSGTHEQWVITAEAAARTEAGECPFSDRPVCRELCYYWVPTGDFMCFVS